MAAGRGRWGWGAADIVSLTEARDLARKARKLVMAGIGLIARCRDAQAAAWLVGMTFDQAADLCIAGRRDSWRNGKHAERLTLDDGFVFPGAKTGKPLFDGRHVRLAAPDGMAGHHRARLPVQLPGLVR